MPVRQTRKKGSGPNPWKNRIVGYGEMTADEWHANPRNPKVHSTSQRDAMTEMMDDVGFIAPAIVNKTSGLAVDGHMRASLAFARGGKIPVAYVELTPEEEAKALAMFDPLGGMVEYDPEAMQALMDDFTMDDDLAAALKGIVPDTDDDDTADEPETVELKPIRQAFAMIAVPIDQWDEVSEVLDQLESIP